MINDEQLSTHFKRSEFACKCGCGFADVDLELVEVLEDLRNHFNAAVYINSACRCKKHNANVGGKDDSQHLLCKAGDVQVKDIAPVVVFTYLNNKYRNKYGIGKYNTFTHIDVRKQCARW